MNVGGKVIYSIKLMFPHDDVAKKIKLKRDKISYFVTYGLGPYFSKNLIENVLQSKFYAVAFDESLNKVSQKQQMDIKIRYWSLESNKVETRYFGSAFLGHTRAVDLLQAFKTQLSDLNLKNLMQISMDGPNVNFKFLKDLKLEMEEDKNNVHKLFDLGSCGLHTNHNALKTGFKNVGWQIINYLRSSYYFFKNLPSRKADYFTFSGSEEFSKKFCNIRWVENKSVALRALSKMPNLHKYIKGVEDNNIKISSESYSIIKKQLDDKLLRPKLAFFAHIAEEMEPFLTMYQSDDPLLPLLYTDLTRILKNLMDKFFKVSKKTFYIYCKLWLIKY